MKNKYMLLGLVVCGLVLTPAAGAATFISGEEVALPDSVVNDDLFIAGNGVLIDKDVDEDVFAGGQLVRIDANVGGDVYVGGNTVQIKGTIGDDLGAAGEMVEIDATSVDDVYAVGNRIEISSGTTVNGSVFGCGASWVIAGTIKKDVKVCGDSIVIKSGAVIEGNLLTYGKNKPAIEEGARVLGDTTHKVGEVKKDERADIGRWVGGVVAWFVAGVLFIYLLPSFGRRVTETAMKNGGKAVGLGLLWFLLFMPAFILLAVTLVGLPIAFMLLLLTGLLGMLALIYATMIIGVWVMNKISKTDSVDIKWQHVLLGVVIYKILGLVPIVGWLLVLAVTLLALGAILINLWQRLRAVEAAATTKTTV